MAGKTFPAFPAHAQPAILRIWQKAHSCWMLNSASYLLTARQCAHIVTSQLLSLWHCHVIENNTAISLVAKFKSLMNISEWITRVWFKHLLQHLQSVDCTKAGKICVTKCLVDISNRTANWWLQIVCDALNWHCRGFVDIVWNNVITVGIITVYIRAQPFEMYINYGRKFANIGSRGSRARISAAGS